MSSRLLRCNQAIGQLPAQPISSYGENSLEARECRRYYPDILRRMLEGPQDWSFANRRVQLAQLGSNDRENEWLYAYALPSDMGSPIRVIPDLASLGLGVPIPLVGQPYAEAWGMYAPLYEQPYIIEGTALYTNTSDAYLEYGTNDVDDLPLPAKVDLAIATELASFLAVPVKQDRKLKLELQNEADYRWQQAIADDQNRQPVYAPNYVSEALAARAGL